MRRALLLAGAVATGAAIGAAGTAALQDDDPPETTTATTAAVAATTTTAPSPSPASEPGVLLAWAQGGVPDAAVHAGEAVPAVVARSIISDGTIDLIGSADASGQVVDDLEAGWRIPLDAIAIDPADHAAVVSVADAYVIRSLGPGEALLGETSAALRRLGPGGRLDLADGTTLTVTAVVPDHAIGAAEVVVDIATGAPLGVDTPRAVLFAHTGDRDAIESVVAGAAAGHPIRFRAPGETPYLRAADAVLPQSVVKATFGEFSYLRGGTDDAITVDPRWVAMNVVTADVPVLGAVRCHRAIIDALTAAMEEIEAAGLADVVRASGFDGCFVPRFTRSGGSISRHSWGIAFDVGFEANPTHVASAQDPRVVEVLQRAGFTWGGTWLVPDAAHFERVTPAATPPPPPG